jgi:hypothetical protein
MTGSVGGQGRRSRIRQRQVRTRRAVTLRPTPYELPACLLAPRGRSGTHCSDAIWTAQTRPMAPGQPPPLRPQTRRGGCPVPASQQGRQGPVVSDAPSDRHPVSAGSTCSPSARLCHLVAPGAIRIVQPSTPPSSTVAHPPFHARRQSVYWTHSQDRTWSGAGPVHGHLEVVRGLGLLAVDRVREGTAGRLMYPARPAHTWRVPAPRPRRPAPHAIQRRGNCRRSRRCIAHR